MSQLTELQSRVLNMVDVNKFISAGEISLRTGDKEKDIIAALDYLTSQRKIFVFGGYPKRWRAKYLEKGIDEEDD